MPELVATQRDTLAMSPDRMAQVRRFPPPYPGMPNALEALSMHERGWWGARFGVDTPYYACPAGWGEWVPLTGAEVFAVDPARVVILPHG